MQSCVCLGFDFASTGCISLTVFIIFQSRVKHTGHFEEFRVQFLHCKPRFYFSCNYSSPFSALRTRNFSRWHVKYYFHFFFLVNGTTPASHYNDFDLRLGLDRPRHPLCRYNKLRNWLFIFFPLLMKLVSHPLAGPEKKKRRLWSKAWPWSPSTSFMSM